MSKNKKPFTSAMLENYVLSADRQTHQLIARTDRERLMLDHLMREKLVRIQPPANHYILSSEGCDLYAVLRQDAMDRTARLVARAIRKL